MEASGVGGLSIEGKFTDVRDAYARCDVVVCPSVLDSFCRVAAEAMLNGLPVVGSDLPPIRDLLGDDEAGLLVPSGDVEAAAKAVARLVDDPELARAGSGRPDGRAAACPRLVRPPDARVTAARCSTCSCASTRSPPGSTADRQRIGAVPSPAPHDARTARRADAPSRSCRPVALPAPWRAGPTGGCGDRPLVAELGQPGAGRGFERLEVGRRPCRVRHDRRARRQRLGQPGMAGVDLHLVGHAVGPLGEPQHRRARMSRSRNSHSSVTSRLRIGSPASS